MFYDCLSIQCYTPWTSFWNSPRKVLTLISYNFKRKIFFALHALHSFNLYNAWKSFSPYFSSIFVYNYMYLYMFIKKVTLSAHASYFFFTKSPSFFRGLNNKYKVYVNISMWPAFECFSISYYYKVGFIRKRESATF